LPAFIVIADDERPLAELLCAIFEGEGHSVHCCYSATSAYEIIEELIPELVVIDMQMEKRWSGLEVVQRMRADTALRDIPVIIYTADRRSLAGIRDTLVAHHCHILEKPFNLYVLLDMVKRMMSLQERDVGSK